MRFAGWWASWLAQLATAGDKLCNLAADFNRLIERFSGAAATGKELARPGNALQQIAAAQIAARRADLLTEMEQGLEEELRQAATTEIRDVHGHVADVVSRMSRTVILRMLQQFAAEQTAAALDGRPHEPLFELASGLKEALPQRFATCGGEQRLLIVAPEQLLPLVAKQTPGEGETPVPTVLADAANDILVCYEVQDISLQRVAAKVLDQRYQAIELASRLHTRSDVPWTPL